MITDNLVVNGLIKVTSQAEVNNLTVDQVNDVSGEEISQLSGTTDNVQEQINALATRYEESIENSTEFKTEVANAVNSLSDEPNLNSESTLEQYVAAISLLGGKNYKGRLTASDDLDNISDDGFYDIVSTDQPINIPSDCGSLNACVEVFNLPEIETIYQRYHKFQGGVFTYSRRKFNGVWSDWVAYTFGVKGNAETSYRSGNVNITPANIGAAESSHNHYNDTLNPACLEFVGSPTYGGYIDFHYGSSEADNTSRIIENVEGNLDINGVGFKSGVVTGTLSGNASTATKLATVRTIALTGSVTGSGTFDGSGNLSITTTLNTITNIYLNTVNKSCVFLTLYNSATFPAYSDTTIYMQYNSGWEWGYSDVDNMFVSGTTIFVAELGGKYLSPNNYRMKNLSGDDISNLAFKNISGMPGTSGCNVIIRNISGTDITLASYAGKSRLAIMMIGFDGYVTSR